MGITLSVPSKKTKLLSMLLKHGGNRSRYLYRTFTPRVHSTKTLTCGVLSTPISRNIQAIQPPNYTKSMVVCTDLGTLQTRTALGRLGFNQQPNSIPERLQNILTGLDVMQQPSTEYIFPIRQNVLYLNQTIWFNCGILKNRSGKVIDGWYDGLLQVQESETGKVYIVAPDEILN